MNTTRKLARALAWIRRMEREIQVAEEIGFSNETINELKCTLEFAVEEISRSERVLRES